MKVVANGAPTGKYVEARKEVWTNKESEKVEEAIVPNTEKKKAIISKRSGNGKSLTSILSARSKVVITWITFQFQPLICSIVEYWR